MQKGLKACADNVFKLMKTTTKKKKTNKNKNIKSQHVQLILTVLSEVRTAVLLLLRV